MEPGEYETIARVENEHWWYRGMAAISLVLLAPQIAAITQPAGNAPRILDAGCGPGGMFKHLARLGRVAGIDFHPLAVQYAKQRAPIARASVGHIPFANSSFQVVTSFDVLYHLAVNDDRQALSEFYRVLQPGGLLLLRVPAFEALRSAHDRQVHTRHRYVASELAAKLRDSGFDIRRITYANFFLSPFVLLLRKLQSGEAVASDVTMPSPLMNKILEIILGAERLLISLTSLPFGVSLFALACKPGAAHAA